MWPDGCYDAESYCTEEEEEAARWLNRYCNSMERLPRLLEMRKDLPTRSWLRLLGESWTLTDNVRDYVNQILFEPPIADMDGPIRAMMDQDEWRGFLALPETLQIYRGCYEGINDDGCCWSLDRNIAANFPTLVRYQRTDSQAVVLHGTVWKHEIIAHKISRNESEIIIRTCDIQHTEYLDIAIDEQ